MKYPVLLLTYDHNRLSLYSNNLNTALYSLESTSSLPEALQRIENLPFPVIVTSLRLTGLGPTGGFKVLEKAQQKYCNSKVIIIADTENKNYADVETIIDKGAFYCLTDPMDFSKLDEVICRAIAHWEKEIEECISMGFLEIDHISRLFAAPHTYPETRIQEGASLPGEINRIENSTSTGTHIPGKKVFIHYGEDDERNAYIIGGILEKSTIPLWKAGENTGPGDTMATLPKQVLTECGIIIVLISRAGKESGWINDEAAERFYSSAMKNKTGIITLLTDDTNIPEILTDTTIVDMRSDPNMKINEIITLIYQILEHSF